MPRVCRECEMDISNRHPNAVLCWTRAKSRERGEHISPERKFLTDILSRARHLGLTQNLIPVPDGVIPVPHGWKQEQYDRQGGRCAGCTRAGAAPVAKENSTPWRKLQLTISLL